MANKYLDENGLLYFWQKITNLFVKKDGSKVLSDNNYTTAEKNKLSDIASGAQANVIESVKVNGTALTVTGKAVDVTVPSYSDATQSKAGLLSAADKKKLDGVASGAEANTINTVKANGVALTVSDKAVDIPVMGAATSSAAGTAGLVPVPAAGKQGQFLRGDGTWQTPSNTNTTYTLTQDATDGHKITLTPSSGTAQTITIPDNNTTYADATQSAPGLMSAADKKKLDGIAEGANKITVDSALSGSSANPVQNKAVNTELGKKANLASPEFTGTPKAPTAAAGTNTTQLATTAFVKTAVDKAISGVTQFRFEVVTALPTTGQTGVIYLMAHSHGAGDAYDEYIWVNNTVKYEKIGNTDVDLSGYLKTTDMTAITNGEIDTIVAS